ncbi:MAG: RNA-binding transcriptional accessory protein [Chloroflexi bacterium]|nr:RNA-binding transcriptional accessory protein [Chloroflexota bacterium]MBT7082007.1 RNA-binding transcriptional accessory protein [Chloroflexota bacterium]MBT7289678.1 RNA-binding transcriptional accessory protein [Chloroflexota bacterium]
MSQEYSQKIAGELKIALWQAAAVAELFGEGATVPFISRYRKERTGSLDEVAITSIRDRLAQLEALDKRRQAILKSLEEQEVLTDELKAAVESAQTMTALEDIYLPYKPKRRTRATIAKEKGLEPLAKLILAQNPSTDPLEESTSYISQEKGVSEAADALSGACDIIAEWVNEDAAARKEIRMLFFRDGLFSSTLVKGKDEEGAKYRDYFDRQELIKQMPSHRLLAVLRGEAEGFLKNTVRPSEPDALGFLYKRFVKGTCPASEQVTEAVGDCYKRLMAPSMETDIRNDAKERADAEAINVFVKNLRQLLMEAALGSKNVLAIDPGFRTGCKVVCLNRQGALTKNTTIFLSQSQQRKDEAADIVRNLIFRYEIEAIAVGNGTGGRETMDFLKNLGISNLISIVLVNESGASIYSASDVAREEFPDYDLTVRGSVSIGRRLMDPLAELVKIDPKSIGVGQYQHDVDQKSLKASLDDVVMSCVNQVGVEVNTASKQLLSYVSGLGPVLAKNIIEYRDQNGPFSSRAQLKKVPRFGPKVYLQAAGFLRIRKAKNPLDASAVHPESYGVVDSMAKDAGRSVADLMGNDELRNQIKLDDYVNDTIGMPTLVDIMQEIAKPGRDPRKQFEAFTFAEGVDSMDKLTVGMKMPGIVTNVTNFGAFVDIGVHQDGLVHISQMANRFVKDPAEIVSVHQKVHVTVLEVDVQRKRIALSMKPDVAQG